MPAGNPTQSQRSAEYEAYLRSPQWQDLRIEALRRAGHRCQVCNRSKRLDVHHRTYERFGNELLDDLTVLCRDCHELFHGSGRSTVRATTTTKKKKADKKPLDSPLKVLAWMKEHPQAVYTRTDIQEGVHLNKGDVTRTCNALVARGDLLKKSTRTWLLPVERDLEAEAASAKARADAAKDDAIVRALSSALGKRNGAAVGPEIRIVQDGRVVGGTPPRLPLTLAEIDAAKTPAGGWTKEQLASWGVPWPPRGGWKRRLLQSAREAQRTRTL